MSAGYSDSSILLSGASTTATSNEVAIVTSRLIFLLPQLKPVPSMLFPATADQGLGICTSCT